MVTKGSYSNKLHYLGARPVGSDFIESERFIWDTGFGASPGSGARGEIHFSIIRLTGEVALRIISSAYEK